MGGRALRGPRRGGHGLRGELRGAVRRGGLPSDDRARAGPGGGAAPLPRHAAPGRDGLRLHSESADARAAGRPEVRQPLAPEGVPGRGVPGAVRERVRRRGAARPVPCARSAGPRARAARRLGPRARGARHHEALLRPVHAGDLRARLRAAQRPTRPRARLRGGASALTRRPEDGALALVLHSHMPYVEGFGTWPFGEEWLWEATACVYLPLLDVLEGVPMTLGLTPVLCDQLEAMRGEAGERYLRFLRDLRAPMRPSRRTGATCSAPSPVSTRWSSGPRPQPTGSCR